MKKQTVTLQQFKAAQKNLKNLEKIKTFKFEQDELTFTADIEWDGNGDDKGSMYVGYLITDISHKNKVVNSLIGGCDSFSDFFHHEYESTRRFPKALKDEMGRIKNEVEKNLKVIEFFGIERENWMVKNPEAAKAKKSPNTKKLARVYLSYDSNKWPKFDQKITMLFEELGGEQFGSGLGFGRRDLDGCILRSKLEKFKKSVELIDKSISIEKVI